MIFDFLERTQLLIGDESVEKLSNSHIIIFGIGGVGAYVAEQLCRAGVGELSLVDGDKVNISNKNRQLIALNSTIEKYKVDVLKQRLLDINPNIKLHTYAEYVKDERMLYLLKLHNYSYVVDAIDTLSPKIYLLYHAVCLKLPVVSSMGTGGKLNPTEFKIVDIAQTYNCPLADVLRKRLHRLGVYTGIKAVFSPEVVDDRAIRKCEEPNKKSIIGTISYMPAIAGCMCASVVIRELLGHEIHSDLPIPHSIKKKIKEQLRN